MPHRKELTQHNLLTEPAQLSVTAVTAESAQQLDSKHDSKVNLEARSKEGKTALLAAAKTNSTSANAKLLVQLGADVNAVDVRNNHVLYYAINNGDVKLIQAICATKELTEQTLLTIPHGCCRRVMAQAIEIFANKNPDDFLVVIKALLGAGAVVDKYAIGSLNGHLEILGRQYLVIVETLLNRDDRFVAKFGDFNGILSRVVIQSESDIDQISSTNLDKLIKRSNISLVDPNDSAYFQIAVKKRNVPLFLALCRNSVRPSFAALEHEFERFSASNTLCELLQSAESSEASQMITALMQLVDANSRLGKQLDVLNKKVIAQRQHRGTVELSKVTPSVSDAKAEAISAVLPVPLTTIKLNLITITNHQLLLKDFLIDAIYCGGTQQEILTCIDKIIKIGAYGVFVTKDNDGYARLVIHHLIESDNRKITDKAEIIKKLLAVAPYTQRMVPVKIKEKAALDYCDKDKDATIISALVAEKNAADFIDYLSYMIDRNGNPELQNNDLITRRIAFTTIFSKLKKGEFNLALQAIREAITRTKAKGHSNRHAAILEGIIYVSPGDAKQADDEAVIARLKQLYGKFNDYLAAYPDVNNTYEQLKLINKPLVTVTADAKSTAEGAHVALNFSAAGAIAAMLRSPAIAAPVPSPSAADVKVAVAAKVTPVDQEIKLRDELIAAIKKADQKQINSTIDKIVAQQAYRALVVADKENKLAIDYLIEAKNINVSEKNPCLTKLLAIAPYQQLHDKKKGEFKYAKTQPGDLGKILEAHKQRATLFDLWWHLYTRDMGGTFAGKQAEYNKLIKNMQDQNWNAAQKILKEYAELWSIPLQPNHTKKICLGILTTYQQLADLQATYNDFVNYQQRYSQHFPAAENGHNMPRVLGGALLVGVQKKLGTSLAVQSKAMTPALVGSPAVSNSEHVTVAAAGFGADAKATAVNGHGNGHKASINGNSSGDAKSLAASMTAPRGVLSGSSAAAPRAVPKSKQSPSPFDGTAVGRTPAAPTPPPGVFQLV